jgi:hypothetical protein
MDSVKFSCVISPSNTAVPLGCEVWIDDTCVFDQNHVAEPVVVSHEFSDDNSEHVLRITLKNKLPEHTRIDEAGDILSDAMLTVSNISFDEIDCTQIVQDLAIYCHNFNGTGADIQDQFFGDMGCNGSIKLKFATPVYLWLLESI